MAYVAITACVLFLRDTDIPDMEVCFYSLLLDLDSGSPSPVELGDIFTRRTAVVIDDNSPSPCQLVINNKC